MFWNIRQTLTHNTLISVVVGSRGCGKSYGAKQWAIDNFIKNGEQFGYIRRYKEDLKRPLEQFFKDIAHEYPDYQFKTEGEKLFIREKPSNEKEKWTEKDIAGFGFVLSTANNKKSISYPNVTTLIYDEFLLDKGNQRYLPNEPLALLNLYETVARPGSGHKRVRLVMLANAISVTNPFFLYFNLKMPTKQDKNGKWIWKHPTKSILVEDVRNESFIEQKRNSEFGQLIEGTDYAEFSIDNKFLLDNDTFIEKKAGNCRYWCTFVYKEHTLGVWVDYNQGKMFVSYDTDPSYPIVYSLTLKDHSPNTVFLKTRSQCRKFNLFIEHYKLGNVRFESVNIKNITHEVIQMSVEK